MRVATYTQPSPASRGSLAAMSLLVLVIILGTRVLSSLLDAYLPALSSQQTIIWLLCYVAALAGLMFTQGINWISWLVRYRLLLVVLLLGVVVSVSWSIDSRLSAERTVHMIGASLIAVYIGFSLPLMTTLRVFASVLAVIVFGSFLAALALPDIGVVEYQGTMVWRGLFNSKNDLGFWAGIGVLLYITLIDASRGTLAMVGCVVMAALCLVLLAFSQSATSLLVTILAGSLTLYLFIANRFQLGFVRMCVLAVLFATLVGFAFANIDTFELVGRNEDLTGRGEVWRQTWDLIMQRPAGGYGYGALWFPTDSTIWIQQQLTDFSWVVFHAHNGFLQVASEIGLPLSVIALLMVAQQLVEIFYCQYERQQVGVLFVLGFVVAYLASNFSEARFLVTRELYWIFFLSLPISMLRQINLSAQHEDDLELPGPATPGDSTSRQTIFGIAAQVPSHWDGDMQDEVDAMMSTLSMSDADTRYAQGLDNDIDPASTAASSQGGRSESRSTKALAADNPAAANHTPAGADASNGVPVELKPASEQRVPANLETTASFGVGRDAGGDPATDATSDVDAARWMSNEDAPPFVVEATSVATEEDESVEFDVGESAQGTTTR